MLWIICFVLATIITLIFAEIVSYLFHRFLFHKNYFTSVRYYHITHHKTCDDAWHDYMVMLLVLFFMAIITIVVTVYFSLSIYLAIYVLLLSLLYFTVNYYIHTAYHNTNHYFYKYTWFNYLVSYHNLHHENAKVNYSILTPLADYLFNTIQWPDYE